MSGPGAVGNTNYQDINNDMLSGNIKVGRTAAQVEAEYRRNTASTAKRVFLGIITFGGYAIYHACKDSKYRSEMKSLCKGTQDFYNNLAEIKKRSQKGVELNDFKGKMCHEDVTFSKNANDQLYVTFSDKSTHEIKDAAQVTKNIELDIMAHSQFFDRNFIVDTILKKYENALSKGREELGQENNVYMDVEEVDRRYDDDQDMNHVKMFNMGRDLSKIRPLRNEYKEQFDRLLAKLFESRLGLEPSETKYIDRSIGVMLAENVMNGTIRTAADARAFINRNASATHFTTVESARIFDQFEEAQAREKGNGNLDIFNADRNDRVPLNTVSFKDGYVKSGDNPLVPAGENKVVHDFVANLISDLNTAKQDRDLTHDASKQAINDKVMITSGERLRKLFSDNGKTVALLMKNREESLKNPETKSLLDSLEPKFRDALNAELDKLNDRYNARVNEIKRRIADTENTIKESLNKGNKENSPFILDLKDGLRRRKDALNYLDDENGGRANFLREELREQKKQEDKIKHSFNTTNLDDVSNEEMDQLGFTKRVKDDESIKAKLGDFYNLSEKREELTLGAHFFSEMELRLNRAADEGCRDFQKKISGMIDSVFPKQAGRVGHDVNSLNNASLTDILGTAAEDNQLQMIKEALKIYFAEMPIMDQRAMLAAEARYCMIDENTSDGAKLGAILKGAGPVMQKMLQGLDPRMFAGSPDFQMAIADMKDKLAPISQEAIHAYLYDIVKNSGGAISKIDVNRALGAASVAQALKCTVHYANGQSRECVIKILRPDAEMKARREFDIFIKAAQTVKHGMEATFRGQFNSILEELDLTNEAKNVAKGNEVYQYSKETYNSKDLKQTYGSFSNVSSMKLAEGIAPTKNVMVLEEVPGSTMETYLNETRDKTREVAGQTRSAIASRGPENAPALALNAVQELDRLYADVRKKYDALVNLSYMWANEGLFAEGFYHGDIHKGNIMTQAGWKEGNPADSGITLIDFGNASHLDKNSRAAVVKVVAGAATNDASLCLEGYKKLLSPESLRIFESNKDEINAKAAAIFQKGTLKDTSLRLQAVIKIMQEDYSIEVPSAIHNFMESQRRLQNAMDDTLAVMKEIAAERKSLISPYIDSIEDEEVKETVRKNIASADSYRPKTLINAITDVVKQNLYAAMKSIGSASKAKQCYDKIRNDEDFLVNQPGGNAIQV